MMNVLEKQKQNNYLKNIGYILFLLFPIAFLMGSFAAEVVTFLFVLSIFIFVLKKGEILIYINKYKFDFILLLFIFFLLIVNIFASSDLLLSFQRNIGFIRVILLVGAIQIALEIYKNKIKKILNFWSLIILVTFFDILLEWKTGKNTLGYSSLDPNRLVGFSGSEEKIGSFLVGFIFPILAFWIKKFFNKNYFFLKKTILLILFLGIILIFLPIGQRSVTLKLFFVLTFAFFLLPYPKKIFKIFFIFLLSLSIFILMSKIESYNNRYIKQIFEPGNVIDKSGYQKGNYLSKTKKIYQASHYWKHHFASYKLFMENPILGVGSKNFRIKCFQVKVNDDHTLDKRSHCSTHPHQTYYEFLSEYGVLGIVMMIIFFIFFFKEFFAYTKDKNIFRLSFLCYFMFIFFPIIPSGSFFSSYSVLIFFINFSLRKLKI